MELTSLWVKDEKNKFGFNDIQVLIKNLENEIYKIQEN